MHLRFCFFLYNSFFLLARSIYHSHFFFMHLLRFLSRSSTEKKFFCSIFCLFYGVYIKSLVRLPFVEQSVTTFFLYPYFYFCLQYCRTRTERIKYTKKKKKGHITRVENGKARGKMQDIYRGQKTSGKGGARGVISREVMKGWRKSARFIQLLTGFYFLYSDPGLRLQLK